MMLTDNTGTVHLSNDTRSDTDPQIYNRRVQEDEFTAPSSRVFNRIPTEGENFRTLSLSFYSYCSSFLLYLHPLFPHFLLSDPLFINLSSAAASAAGNWWAEAVSHTEVTVHTYTCIDAEGVILAGLHAQSQLPIMWLLLPASHPHDPIRSPDLSNQLLWQPAGRRADRGSRAVPIS